VKWSQARQSSAESEFCTGGCVGKSYLQEFGSEGKNLCVIFGVIQRDCYSSCVKICCQEMASSDYSRLRILVCV
jgi:hypothetical protein